MSTPHNPEKLTPEQVNPPVKRYRLLDEDGVGVDYIRGFREIQSRNGIAWTSGMAGSLMGVTYRTNLTRAELAEARRKAK